MSQQHTDNTTNGFTLTELIAAVAITGVLSSIALPGYVDQLNRTSQNECSAAISQAMTSTMAFNDELSEYPTSWSDLNSMSAIMKESGSAENDDSFDDINLSNKRYAMSASRSGNIFNFECIAREKSLENYNVLGCLNLSNGASEIKRGSKEAKAEEVSCGLT